jgi:hypothetical protein
MQQAHGISPKLTEQTRFEATLRSKSTAIRLQPQQRANSSPLPALNAPMLGRSELAAQLQARSRSCRATRSAKKAISVAINGSGFSGDERETHWNLAVEFRKRNPTYDYTRRRRRNGPEV